jgi:hypothetical protein
LLHRKGHQRASERSARSAPAAEKEQYRARARFVPGGASRAEKAAAADSEGSRRRQREDTKTRWEALRRQRRQQRRGASRAAPERQGKPRRPGPFLLFRPAPKKMSALSAEAPGPWFRAFALSAGLVCAACASAPCCLRGCPRARKAQPRPTPHSTAGAGHRESQTIRTCRRYSAVVVRCRACAAVCLRVLGSVHDRRHSWLSSVVA